MHRSVASLASLPANSRPETAESSRLQSCRKHSHGHFEPGGWLSCHRQTSGRCPVRNGQQAFKVLQSFQPTAQKDPQRLICRSSALSDVSFASEDDFNKQITEHPVVVVDWMAKWCRKCIYLKPKLERMLRDEFPGVPLVFIDVNSVSGGLVYGQGIKKMPTIAVYQDGEKVTEHIAAETGSLAIDKIRQMIKAQVDSTKPKTGPFAWVQDVFKSQDPSP
ncbi:hypothetical protein WJX84_002489 [Apatococcus fuscideae]|uniref:Thioredoxin domain-containing protein n=1 Tax=Apatococcus fuscideae TaxID=2026836 RepID=A0AAW1RRF9_9CHLO